MMSKLFGNILGGLYSKEYLEQNGVAKEETATPEVEEPVTPTAKPTVSSKATYAAPTYTAPVTIPSAGNSTNRAKIREKLHNLLVKINKDGIDFFELWDATLEMDGGVNPANIKNAFKLLVKMSGGTLSLGVVNDTYQYYVDQIQSAMNDNIKSEENEKQKLTDAMTAEQDSLTQKVEDLKTQIASLIQEKAQAETDLAQLGSKYTPNIQSIETMIEDGKAETAYLIGEMTNFLKATQSAIQ